MCDFIDAFAPAPKKKLVLPSSVRGVTITEAAITQKDFAVQNGKARGIPLTVQSGAQCLCGFDDWPALYEIGRTMLDENQLPWVSFLWFWASDRYALTEKVVDPYDLEACVAPQRGEVLVLRPEPPARREHRLHVRTLAKRVDTKVTLTLKGGRALHGTLVAFDVESECGQVDDETFVAAQVHAVSD